MPLSPGNMYAEILREDLYAFIHRTFLELNPGTSFVPSWYLEVLTAKLVDVITGKCRRLIINIPPRHLKSHSVSIAFVAWALARYPTKQILAISYAQDLADKLARDCRTLMNSSLYHQICKTRLSSDRQAVADFETTAGGGRFSTSIGGVLTGRGADIIVIDDPMKADDALSEARRTGVNQWFDNTLRSRLNNQETGAIIIVMQRLHANYLVGHVSESEHWDVLSFSAIAEDDETYTVSTPYGARQFQRATGEALEPRLMSAEAVEKQRHAMTEYNFAAQYQQNPQPPSGLIVRREWLRFYKPHEKPNFEQIIQSWDTASKVSEHADYSVCTTWGLKERKLYLLDVYRRKVEFPELKRAVRELAGIWNAGVVLVEDKSSGIQLIQELRSEGFFSIKAGPPLAGDKETRLRFQTAKVENGAVLFPEAAPWLDAYLLELTTFPNAKNDDQVDSTVMALAWLTEALSAPHAGIREYYRQQAAGAARPVEAPLVKVEMTRSGFYTSASGHGYLIPPDSILELPQRDAELAIKGGTARPFKTKEPV